MWSEPGNRSADRASFGRGLLVAAVVFLGLGFGLETLTCWQQSRPAEALPGVGSWALRWLGSDVVEGGALSPDLLRALQTLGGALLTCLALVTLQIGGFGIRSRASAPRPLFPHLARAAVCLSVAGGLALGASFFAPGGPARVGWPASLPPVETVSGTWRFDAQTLGLLGLGLLGLSLLSAAVNGLAHLRGSAGLVAGGTRSWSECAQRLAAGLLLVGVPIALAVVALQLMDNVSGSRLLTSLPLWPEPAACWLGFATMLLLLLSVGVAFDLLLGPLSEGAEARARPLAARWFALAILVGAGLTLLAAVAYGLRSALPVAAGVAFCAVNAWLYVGFSGASGRRLNEFWGKVHCILSLLYLGLFLLPSLLSGDGGGAVAVDSPAATQRFHALWMLALAQTPLCVNWLWSRRHGPLVTMARSGVVAASAGGPDVTREGASCSVWACPRTMNRIGGSVVGLGVPPSGGPSHVNAELQTVGSWGKWTLRWRLFLVATIIGFLALVFFALRVRAGSNDWRLGASGSSVATLGSLALVLSAATLWAARSALRKGRQRRARLLIGMTVLLGLSFLSVRGWECRDRLTHDFVRLTDGREFIGRVGGQALDRAAISQPDKPAMRLIQLQRGPSSGESVLLPADEVELIESLGPWRSRPLAIWFLLTGLHALLVMAGVLLLAGQLLAGGGAAGGAPGRLPWFWPAGVGCWVVATAMGVVFWVLFAV
jgi:heme/copper-type cytochrome/quinol oxidase subunit 3